jgi:formate hydrogenlyase subunit 6/NADH:ubiquinone oxidoreductase subunit I
MRVVSMFKDALQSVLKKPATDNYPAQRPVSPERLRGRLYWDPSHCTGCRLCVKDCPANAIELIDIDRKNKRFVMRYHMDRCTYCAQCVVNCRFGCINMSSEEWELAGVSKKPFEVYYGDEADLERLLAGCPEDEPKSTEEA